MEELTTYRHGKALCPVDRVALGHLYHPRSSTDTIDGGEFFLSGTVRIVEDGDEVPAKRKIIVILPSQNMRVVREAYSDPVTGSWLVAGLVKRDYLVLCRDESGNYNAAVYDWVQPG